MTVRTRGFKFDIFRGPFFLKIKNRSIDLINFRIFKKGSIVLTIYDYHNQHYTFEFFYVKHTCTRGVHKVNKLYQDYIFVAESNA